ncbi:MAG TPA: PQQ-dependent sugar dehydrogenase [Bryobacteraceae bacterium]|nr:PQQ-dependent sugar dehydrogenase [Bryobacteraceae bacterium]
MHFSRIALVILWSALSMAAATLPNGFAEQVISGIQTPTAMAFAPDGRLFVCQQNGQLRVIKNGVLLSTPFVTVQTDTSIERGLIGVVVPDSEFVYVYYTVPGTPAKNRVSRFTQVAGGDVAVSGSEFIVTELGPLAGSIHNGGAMHFGPDGKLYVAVGENGVSSNAQSLQNRLGKILRLNADGTSSDGSIPNDNPFYTSPTDLNGAIWAYGLRNPFNFAFQPGTGKMFINDVGKDAWEEVNEGVKGANYGWPGSEGPTTVSGYKSPFYSYSHPNEGCAITGGTFYNPTTSNFPVEYTGKYFFADYCQGWIKALNPSTAQVTDFATGIQSPVGLAVGPAGSLYYLSYSSNSLVKVDYSAGSPVIQQHPQNTTVPEGEPATFTVTATGAQPLSYQWQRNSQDIQGATASTLNVPSVTAADNKALFSARVTNIFSPPAASNAATLTVTPNTNNQAPQGTITAPTTGTLYSGGQTIAYSGTGTDREDGTLAAANFCWVINFHHDSHTHPFLPQTCGATSGNVTIPVIGETSANVWYRFQLTVRDSGGRTHTSFFDLQPRIVTFTLQSNPAGQQLTLDGQPATSPLQVTAVVGMTRSIGAPGQTPTAGTRLGFASWSDNGAATHDIVTPAVNTTYTATFTTQHLLTLDASASSGLGSIAANPATDGFYNAGSSVQLTAIPAPGLQFGAWSGDASGSVNPLNLVMSGPRNVSAFFGTTASCTYALNHGAATVSSAGDIREVDVVTGTGCSWWTTSQTSWVTVVSGASGNGPGGVRLRITPSIDPVPRVGTIIIAGVPFTLTQSAGNCRFDITGPSTTLSGSFGAYSLSIATNPACQWTATAFPPSIMLGATSGTGSGILNFSLPQNNAGPTAGYITVGGQFWHFIQKSLAPVQPFSDVPLNFLFFDSISLLKSNNITPGCGGTRFCPDDPMTRAEMAAFLIRALYGETFNYPPQPIFTDVGVAHPYFSYIQKLSEIGVTAGCTPTTYCPNETVTRGQMAAFLVRARFGITHFETFPSLTTPLFEDVPAGDIFFAYIQKLKELGITNGCTTTRFCPTDPNARGQMAVFIIRAFFTP